MQRSFKWCLLGCVLLAANAAAEGYVINREQGYVFNPNFNPKSDGAIMLSATESKLPGADLPAKIESAKALLAREIQERALCQEGHYVLSIGLDQQVTLRARCKEVYTRADAEYWQKINSADGIKDPATAIFVAAANGYLKSLRSLIERDPKAVNTREEGGYTPLAVVIQRNAIPWTLRIETAELLLKLGADPNAATNAGLTPLHLLVHSLITIEPPETLQLGDMTSTLIPEDEAAFPEARRALRILIASGANVNSPARGHPPLHAVAAKGWLTLADDLLTHGADVNAVDRAGRTALWMARAPMFKLLLDRKADVNQIDQAGENILFALMRDGKADSLPRMQLALQRGADAKRINAKGLSAASKDVLQGVGIGLDPLEHEKMSLLIEAGATR